MFKYGQDAMSAELVIVIVSSVIFVHSDDVFIFIVMVTGMQIALVTLMLIVREKAYFTCTFSFDFVVHFVLKEKSSPNLQSSPINNGGRIAIVVSTIPFVLHLNPRYFSENKAC